MSIVGSRLIFATHTHCLKDTTEITVGTDICLAELKSIG